MSNHDNYYSQGYIYLIIYKKRPLSDYFYTLYDAEKFILSFKRYKLEFTIERYETFKLK